MENLTFVEPVTIKLYVKRGDYFANRPYTTMYITTAEGLVSALHEYIFDRVVYNSSKTDIRYIVYAHREFANHYALLKF